MIVPNPDNYQLRSGDPHGGVNCTAYCGAWLVEVATGGKITTTGEEVRAHSSEPSPARLSPGLNLPQVDDSVRRITHGDVDLDTRTGYSIVEAQRRIIDGAWAIVQVRRGILVAAGDGGANEFAGGHAEVVSYRDGAPRLGDPLVGHYIQTTWGTLWRAAGALITNLATRSVVGQGRANVSFTRDVTTDYVATIRPLKGHDIRRFNRFILSSDGRRIVGRVAAQTEGFSRPCTPPRWYDWPGHNGRSLVQITEGAHKGQWVRSHWSHEA